jgi:hypothetical protein
VPVQYTRRPILNLPQIQDLLAMGMEIGSHTLSHPILTRLHARAVFHELDGSKKRLEDMLGQPITSVCYPEGKFNRTTLEQAVRAGYQLGRTTVAYRTGLSFNPVAMPISCQFVRHRVDKPIRHALREGNMRGLADWWRLYRMERDPLRLARMMFDRVLARGGVLHVWGHSWELDGQGLWDAFAEFLRQIGRRPGVEYVTNTALLEARQEAPGTLVTVVAQ